MIKRNPLTRPFIFLCMILFAVHSVSAKSPIKYELSFVAPQTHYVKVNMQVADISKDYLDVSMPVWAPGSYLVREFSKNVEEFQVHDANGMALKAEKISKETWRIKTNKIKTVNISYNVYAFEISVRTSFIDDSHAFISPTGIFMFPDNELDRSSEIKIDLHQNWSKISTGLDAVTGEKNTFSAPNYDVLYDSPIEIGNQDVFSFTAAGVLHEVAMVGIGNYDKERLKVDMAKIVETETKVYGENPNKRYVFIVHHYATGSGGLEHLNSTVLGASRFTYDTNVGYVNFLSLVAHEYFHLWNVKRLRPKALGPFNYHEENYTTSLWIAEGFTAYYDNLIVRRAGLVTADHYLKTMATEINTVENTKGNHIQSLSEASFDAWIKYYRTNENSGNTNVSYYNKGALMAMLIDLKILHASGGEKGLDDVMKAAYQHFYKEKGQGYTEAEFKVLAEKVGGVNLDDIYGFVNQPCSPDYNTYLSYIGIKAVDLNAGNQKPSLGIRSAASNGKVLVKSVSREGSAWASGINVNDELIAVNGYRINDDLSELDQVIFSKTAGDKINVTVARDGILKEIPVVLKADSSFYYVFQNLSDSSSENENKIFKAWISEK